MAEDLDWGDQPDYRQPAPAPVSKLPPLARDAIERAREKLAEAKNNPLCNFGVVGNAPAPEPGDAWPVHEQEDADFVSSTPADGDPVAEEEADPGYEQAAAGSIKLGDQVWVDDVWRRVAGLVVDPPPSTTQVYWEDQDPDAEPHEFGNDEIVYVARG